MCTQTSADCQAQISTRIAVLLGALLTLLQFGFVLFVQHRTVGDAYHRLYQWDSEHYADITEHWYTSTVYAGQDLAKDIQGSTNVSFFPAYPLFSRLLMLSTGMSPLAAMQSISLLATWVFWTYLLLLLSRLQIFSVVPVVLLAFAYPSAFFLVVPYSESLFLASVLGYLYWSNREGKRSWCIAAAHGVCMTATKLIGLPIALLPLFLHLFHRKPLKTIGWPILLAVIACMGAASFFLYSAVSFGYWDLYFQTQHMWWGINPDSFFLFGSNTPLLPPALTDWSMDSDFMSKLSTVGVVWFFVFLGCVEGVLYRYARDTAGAWKKRLPLYCCAFAAYFIAAAGVHSRGMVSMIRYSYVSYLLLIIAWVHILDLQCSGRTKQRFTLVAGFVSFWFLLLQYVLLMRFTDGVWVA